MSAEADAVRGAEYGVSSPERVNTRNGYRHREFDTHAGTLEVAIGETALRFLLSPLAARAPQAGGGRADLGRSDLLPARRVHRAHGQARDDPLTMRPGGTDLVRGVPASQPMDSRERNRCALPTPLTGGDCYAQRICLSHRRGWRVAAWMDDIGNGPARARASSPIAD
jgi:hypothetical protein